jgi:hypothetical protein
MRQPGFAVSMTKFVLSSCALGEVIFLGFLRDVKMGYRRLKEKVKEYNRRDAKFYGNIIEKLSKMEGEEADVSFLLTHLVSTTLAVDLKLV